MAYSKLYRESGTNKMAPAGFNFVGARTIGCSIQSFFFFEISDVRAIQRLWIVCGYLGGRGAMSWVEKW